MLPASGASQHSLIPTTCQSISQLPAVPPLQILLHQPTANIPFQSFIELPLSPPLHGQLPSTTTYTQIPPFTLTNQPTRRQPARTPFSELSVIDPMPSSATRVPSGPAPPTSALAANTTPANAALCRYPLFTEADRVNFRASLGHCQVTMSATLVIIVIVLHRNRECISPMECLVAAADMPVLPTECCRDH